MNRLYASKIVIRSSLYHIHRQIKINKNSQLSISHSPHSRLIAYDITILTIMGSYLNQQSTLNLHLLSPFPTYVTVYKVIKTDKKETFIITIQIGQKPFEEHQALSYLQQLLSISSLSEPNCPTKNYWETKTEINLKQAIS